MADTVSSNVILDNDTHHVVHLVGKSDGTGETDVVKVDKSALAVATDGAEAAALDLEKVRWSIQGYAAITLEWDRAATDDVIMHLCGSGYEDFNLEGAVRNLVKTKGLADPRTGGASTGDVLLTSVGAIANATYDITLTFRKNPD